jgi:hypothetical protein
MSCVPWLAGGRRLAVDLSTRKPQYGPERGVGSPIAKRFKG